MFNKKKKTMYVPDEDILAYNNSKQNVENDFAIVDDDTISDDIVLETDVSDSTENSAKKSDRFIGMIKKVIPMRKDGVKLIVIKCVSIVAALAVIISGTYLGIYFADLSRQNAKIENIRNHYDLNRDDYTLNADNQFSKFDVLKTQNPDIVGWITINNTEVDNPVYQTDNNDFYVKNDMDRKPNSYGALFVDFRCNLDPKLITQNQIIYGHNMRYGAMFGTLDEYRKLDYYKKNPLISFDSLYEQREYKIFAIMLVNDDEDDAFGYTYTAYRTDFVSDTDFLQWIDRSRQRSLIDTTVDVKAEDEIITLSTCAYDYTNARLVILGRLVRDGESNVVDVASAKTNKNVLYSKRYYDKKGIAVPKIADTATSSTSNK